MGPIGGYPGNLAELVAGVTRITKNSRIIRQLCHAIRQNGVRSHRLSNATLALPCRTSTIISRAALQVLYGAVGAVWAFLFLRYLT